MILADCLRKLDQNGLLLLEKIISEKKVRLIKKKLEKTLDKRIKKNQFVGDERNLILWNYFFDDKSLLELLELPLVDKILKQILDPNYVLQSSVAQSRSIFKKELKVKKKAKLGISWHTDSRYLNRKKISKGFSYLVIIALDDFDKNNGTRYIPKSHNFSKQPKRSFSKLELKKLKVKTLKMKAGSVCIMDTGTYHQAGEPTVNSRWSIFSIYTGWFVKPYFDYSKIYKKFKMTENTKRILHYFSRPPEIDHVRGTLSKNFDQKAK
tara:strand:- start:154 stop:951 length:798 start_codon:yes stop_codon:yes gene_type:complete